MGELHVGGTKYEVVYLMRSLVVGYTQYILTLRGPKDFDLWNKIGC